MRSANSVKLVSAAVRLGSKVIGAGACATALPPMAERLLSKILRASVGVPLIFAADRIAFSRKLGEPGILASSSAEFSSIGKFALLAMRPTIFVRMARLGFEKRTAKFMRRTTAGPSLSMSFVIQIVGVAVLSTRQFKKTLLP